MPHCDGIEATRQIRALGYNYPILGLSSYSENHNIKECMEAGMNTFIPKPIDKEKLRKAVKVFVPPTIKESDEENAASPSSPTVEQPLSPRTIPADATPVESTASNSENKTSTAASKNPLEQSDQKATPTLNGEQEAPQSMANGSAEKKTT
jgi:YesN/AraC family two-component response regulator